MSVIKMKNSGIKWLGLIPENWKLTYIKHIVTPKSNKGFPDNELLSVYREYGVVIKSSREDNHNKPGKELSDYKSIVSGDLVINKMKAWQGSLGISNFKGIVSPAYITCSVKKNVNSKYLHYLLRNKQHIEFYGSISYGVRVGQWDMRFDDFKYTPVLIPPALLQIKIANFLDEQTSKIDKQILLLEKKVALMEEYNQSQIFETVTKGLDKNVKMKDSGLEWIGEIPEHWVVKRVKECVKKTISGGTPLAGDETMYNENGVPWVVIGDLTNSNIIFDTKNKVSIKGILDKKLTIIPKGTLLYSMYASVGYSSLLGVDATINQAILALFVNHKMENKFLKYSLDAFRTEILSGVTGTTQVNLNAEKVKNIKVLVPDIKEQKQIAKFLDEKCSIYEKKRGLINKKIELLKEYKQSLIYEAVTGKLDIN